MKNLFWSLGLVFCSISICNAQKVFVTEYENQAAVKVFAVDYENQADLLVYKVNYENQVGKNNTTNTKKLSIYSKITIKS